MSSAASAFPPVAGQYEAPVGLVRFYYSETFAYLIRANHGEIDRRLIDLPTALRARRLAPELVGVEKAGPEAVWGVLNGYLAHIEARMAEIAACHSPAFWFHLYRRISPVLSSKHVGKRDNTTVTLVRQIAELAYLKHGDQTTTNDLGWITATAFSDFLGGHFKAAMVRALGSVMKARRHYNELRNVNQSVMLKFTEEDLFSAFEVEGLAYEYWKTSAAMRSLGKGVRLEWNEDAQWFVDHADGPDPLLFAVFDHRIAGQTGLCTRLGTWTQLVESGADFSTIYFAGYNPNGEIEEYPVWDRAGQRIVYGQARLNFHIGRAPIQTFLESHAFMAPDFEKRHRVKLEAVIFCLQIAAFFAFFPDRAVFSKDNDERNTIIVGNLTNLYFRGYKQVGLQIDTIADEALWWAKQMNVDTTLDAADVQAGFDFLMLNDTSAKLIGLWSGGKRPLILPVFNGLLIDAAAIGPILANLFFGVRETTGAKGFAFEDGARAMFEEAGLEVAFAGEIEFADGTKREIDAGLRIGDRLVLVECFSFEKPVDFELAKPGVFAARIARITEKIEQARTLAVAVEAQPKGANFDFTWARTIDWRLATPSVEFAWEISSDLFDSNGVPRILQLGELIAFLTKRKHPAEPFRGALAAAVSGPEPVP